MDEIRHFYSEYKSISRKRPTSVTDGVDVKTKSNSKLSPTLLRLLEDIMLGLVTAIDKGISWDVILSKDVRWK